MKKRLFLLPFLLFIVVGVYAQTTESPVSQLDAAAKKLAGELNNKLTGEKGSNIAVGQFSYREFITPLGQYWANQITEELSNIPKRSFTLLSVGPSGADWAISGEIVETSNIIRIYTRLTRSTDRAIGAIFHSDFARSEHIIGMLYSGDGSGGNSSSSAPRDAWEPDSWDNPVTFVTGVNENVPVMNRTLHDASDEDFFLIVPESNGRLVMETTGSIDTYMHFYDADTNEELATNDDGGSNQNARIRNNAQAGRRYIAKVRGYGSSETGHYGFRAYLQASAAPDEFEPDNEPTQANFVVIGIPQQHNFHSDDDVDWVKFQITKPGRYTIRARGVVSTNLDTVIELFDAELNSITEDDDGGEGYDSRISLRLDSGLYYLKVYYIGSDPDQPYTVSITAE